MRYKCRRTGPTKVSRLPNSESEATFALSVSAFSRSFHVLLCLLVALVLSSAQSYAKETPPSDSSSADDYSEQTLAPAPDAAPSKSTAREPRYPFRMLNGLESSRRDSHSLLLYRGSATDNTGQFLLQLPRTLTLDILKVGPGGRDDAATQEDVRTISTQLEPDTDLPLGYRAVYRKSTPMAGRPLSGWYYIALLNEGKPGSETKAILTRVMSSMGVGTPGHVVADREYVARRTLPIAYYYDAEKGFRPMICYGWPMPFCLWTRVSEPPAYFRVASNVTALAPRTIDLKQWVPPTGRIARLDVVVRAVSSAGGAMLQTIGGSPGGFRLGNAQRVGDELRSTLDISTTSQRIISVVTDKGVDVDLYALGFSVLQPQ